MKVVALLLMVAFAGCITDEPVEWNEMTIEMHPGMVRIIPSGIVNITTSFSFEAPESGPSTPPACAALQHRMFAPQVAWSSSDKLQVAAGERSYNAAISTSDSQITMKTDAVDTIYFWAPEHLQEGSIHMEYDGEPPRVDYFPKQLQCFENFDEWSGTFVHASTAGLPVTEQLFVAQEATIPFYVADKAIGILDAAEMMQGKFSFRAENGAEVPLEEGSNYAVIGPGNFELVGTGVAQQEEPIVKFTLISVEV